MNISFMLFPFIALIIIVPSYAGKGGLRVYINNSSTITLSDDDCCKKLDIYGYDVGNKRYVVEWNYRTNWFGAMEFCRYHGMRLATIMSHKEQDALTAYIKHLNLLDEEIWIAGNDLVKTGSYNWLSTGAPMIFRNFRPGQPDNAVVNNEVEHCVHLRNDSGKINWNDRPCSVQKLFVCEYIL